MTTELTILGWALVLALVQIFIPAALRNKETGRAYNIGPRDEPGPPIGKVTGRLQRAHRNLLETLPIFAAAILIAHVANREGVLTLWGAWLYFVGEDRLRTALRLRRASGTVAGVPGFPRRTHDPPHRHT